MHASGVLYTIHTSVTREVVMSWHRAGCVNDTCTGAGEGGKGARDLYIFFAALQGVLVLVWWPSLFRGRIYIRAIVIYIYTTTAAAEAWRGFRCAARRVSSRVLAWRGNCSSQWDGSWAWKHLMQGLPSGCVDWRESSNAWGIYTSAGWRSASGRETAGDIVGQKAAPPRRREKPASWWCACVCVFDARERERHFRKPAVAHGQPTRAALIIFATRDRREFAPLCSRVWLYNSAN